MNALKNILKLIAGLCIGMLIGLLIAFVFLCIFSDLTVQKFIDNLADVDISGVVLSGLTAIASFIISICILIPVHEAGHLAGGLLSGYRFVSFRIFNLTFIKEEGKLKIKRYSIAGTGGQCLMSPPDRPITEIPTVLYNLSGILANLLVLLIALPLLFADINVFIRIGVIIFIIVDAGMILLNGIPMQIGGIGNDGYNALTLRKNPESARGFIIQLKTNALIQSGIRPKDMPDEYFILPAKADYSNPMNISLFLMSASRKLDMLDFESTLRDFEELYSHKSEIMPLLVKEIECELIFLRLAGGETEKAKELMTPALMKYLADYSKTMSSKARTLAAIALYLENDRAKANTIYQNLINNKENYLLQGEVLSDIAILEKTMHQ